ncbi:hypothetical protein [Nocardia sp. NPDC004711]
MERAGARKGIRWDRRTIRTRSIPESTRCALNYVRPAGIVELDREFAALDIAPDGMPDLRPELPAPKEVRRLFEEANSGLLRVLEILEDARGNAVLITDPNRSD